MRTVWLTSWQGSRRFDADACCKRDHTVLKLSHYIFLTDARTYCHPLFWYQSCACLGSALCDDFTRNLTSWGTPTTLMQWTPVSCVANRYLVVILQGLLKLLSLFLFWSTTFYREGFPEKSAVFFSFTGVCLSTEGGGSLSREGVSVWKGLYPVGLCQGDHPYGKEHAICMLLECILVQFYKL